MKVLLLPGNHSANIDTESWYAWVANQVKLIGLNIIAKNMPDPELARKEFWLPFIEKELGDDKESIIIGHSSGAIAALKFAESHKLQGIILVGAYYTDLGDEYEIKSHYFDDPWQWDKIKQNVKRIVQFHSLDDPYIPIEEARYVAKQLNTEYHEYNTQGHFVENNTFPELIDALKKELNS